MESLNLISKWFGFSDAKAVLRHGKPVEIDQIDANHVASYLKNKIDYFLSVGFQSVAIICKDESSVNELSKKLNQNNIMHHKISSKNTEYDGGVCLVSSYLAKGLEFDAVLILDVEKYDVNKELDMKLLYVAMTRGLHELYITYQKDIIYPLRKLKQ